MESASFPVDLWPREVFPAARRLVSRGFGTPKNLSRGARAGPPRMLRVRLESLYLQLGFLRTPKSRLDASTTFAGRLRDVIYRGGGVKPEPRSSTSSGASASSRAKTQPYTRYRHLTARCSVSMCRWCHRCDVCAILSGSTAGWQHAELAGSQPRPFLPSTRHTTAQVRDQTAAQVRRR